MCDVVAAVGAEAGAAAADAPLHGPADRTLVLSAPLQLGGASHPAAGGLRHAGQAADLTPLLKFTREMFV